MAIIDKMEAQLRPPTIGLKPYEAKVIPLTSGEDMLVREATWDEIPLLMETIEPLMKQPKDFYDIGRLPHLCGAAGHAALPGAG